MQQSGPSERENADVGSQRNSVWESCSARLGVIRLAIRKFGGGSDFENIDARWRKRDGREFRLRGYRLLMTLAESFILFAQLLQTQQRGKLLVFEV